MVIDPVNLLAPSPALMLSTSAMLTIFAAGVIYLLLKLVRGIAHNAGPVPLSNAVRWTRWQAGCDS
jgi:hypothetical protein